MSVPLSVLILTLNEEKNLPGALESLKPYVNDVVVLDSFSTDRTAQIAERFGARVVFRAFDNYANQRQFGLSDIPFENEWVAMIDADERIPPTLWEELRSKLPPSAPDVVMFRVRRKDVYFGRWLKRSSAYPTWFGRIIKRGKVTVKREVNEEYVPTGEVVNLHEHLLHFPMNRGIFHWVDRHNHYSSMEAKLKVNASSARLELTGMFSRDPVLRRHVSKQIAMRLPFRPFLVFIYLYVARLGFLEGAAGFKFCALRATYEFLIDLKVAELRAGNQTDH